MILSIRTLSAVLVACAATLLALPAGAQDLVTPAAPTSVAVPVAPASAAVPTTATQAATPEIKVSASKVDPKDPDAVVCKTEKNTGSRIASTKRCQSRRQWTEQARDAQKQLIDKPSAASGQ